MNISRNILLIAKSFACLFQLLDIHIVTHIFDWSRARKYGLLWEKWQYWPWRSHLIKEWPQNIGKVFESSDRIDQKLRRKISTSWIEDMARTHSANKYVISVWSCVNGHFTAKRLWDRVELVQILSWFTFCPWPGMYNVVSCKNFVPTVQTPRFHDTLCKLLFRVASNGKIQNAVITRVFPRPTGQLSQRSQTQSFTTIRKTYPNTFWRSKMKVVAM